jgi:hypothetical protein
MLALIRPASRSTTPRVGLMIDRKRDGTRIAKSRSFNSHRPEAHVKPTHPEGRIVT